MDSAIIPKPKAGACCAGWPQACVWLLTARAGMCSGRAVDDKSIWDEEELEADDGLVIDPSDKRERPEYDILYKQEVTANVSAPRLLGSQLFLRGSRAAAWGAGLLFGLGPGERPGDELLQRDHSQGECSFPDA